MVMEDIQRFKEEKKLDRMVMVWCGSTEIFMKPEKVHQDITSFEKAMKENDELISIFVKSVETAQRNIEK